MLTNKIIAERINVLLNLLFHLEDYINNQQQREEQIHISDLVKSVLTEVTSSEVIKNYFFKGADAKNEINEEKDEIKSEFKLNKLTEQKINYIKKINPQSFNQKNLDVLNFFYNSSGEADMIYDLVKKKIFNKINFALINKNSYYKKVESNWKNKDKNIYRSKSSIRNKFISSPNFIIPPSSLPEGLGPNPKKKIFPKIENNSNYKSNMYKKIGFAKNYKLIQTNSEEKYEEINNNKSPGFNKLKQNKITSETKLDLINILHKMRKKPIFSDNKNKPKNNLIKSYEKIPEIKISKKKENKIDNKKIYLKKDKKDAPFTKEFDYNTVFNMFDALKKRGYLY